MLACKLHCGGRACEPAMLPRHGPLGRLQVQTRSQVLSCHDGLFDAVRWWTRVQTRCCTIEAAMQNMCGLVDAGSYQQTHMWGCSLLAQQTYRWCARCRPSRHPWPRRMLQPPASVPPSEGWWRCCSSTATWYVHSPSPSKCPQPHPHCRPCKGTTTEHPFQTPVNCTLPEASPNLPHCTFHPAIEYVL
jgi:hypothetical protein